MVEIVDPTPAAHAVVASSKINDIQALVAEFEKLCTKGGEADNQSIYYLRTQYKISSFIERVLCYLKCTDETIISAGIFIERWCSTTSTSLSFDNIFKLLLAAMLAAVKSREDEFYSNSYYATIWGLPLSLVNKMETDFLNEIEWELYITEDQYLHFIENARASSTK